MLMLMLMLMLASLVRTGLKAGNGESGKGIRNGGTLKAGIFKMGNI